MVEGHMRRRELVMAGLVASLPIAARAAARPVVLELFTSQGCSSCPPADALLGELARRADVIALAWHVDYWDNLGWHDRFASPTSTARQKAYARQLDSVVFTPALVVDGSKVVVGSERASVEQAIAAAAAAALPVSVTIDRTVDALAVDIGAAAGPVRAQRIVYDPVQATDVGAGENDGRRLRDYRIVRDVETLADWDGAARRFTIKPGDTGQGVAILVQAADLRVLGAADLPPARSAA
jgi:hypothetical protein